MPKSRAKRKLRKRVERPDGGEGDDDNELSLPARMYVSLYLSCLSACLPIDSTGRDGGLSGLEVGWKGGREGKKSVPAAQTFRDATGQCDAIRYDTVQYNAMRFDGRWTRELTRLDSTRTTGQGRAGRPAARETKERLPALLLQPVSHQSSTVSLCTR